MKNETTMPVNGTELLTKVNEMREVNATNTEIALACNYLKENGQPDFVPFYEALIEAKGLNEPTEDPEMSELEAELRERFGDAAVDAFIDYWSIDDLEFFEDAYQCAERPEDFARELVEDCYGIDVPSFLEIDWSGTWNNLRHDFIELNGYIFSQNW
jgi:hypothetical protein